MLSGRFMYGPLDVVTLTGEKVWALWGEQGWVVDPIGLWCWDCHYQCPKWMRSLRGSVIVSHQGIRFGESMDRGITMQLHTWGSHVVPEAAPASVMPNAVV